jgi:hypothetical protein
VHHGTEISRDKQIFSNVLSHKPKALVTKLMLDVLETSREQVVEHQHVVPVSNQAIDEM